MKPTEATKPRSHAQEDGPKRSARARSCGVVISAPLAHAVGDAVKRRLGAELGDRGLLLAANDFAAAEAEIERCGAGLLTALIRRCYPVTRQAGGKVAVGFGSEGTPARLRAALAFGATSARVLVPGLSNPDVELACAAFNLSAGLVDGLCDQDIEIGGTLIELLEAGDLAGAAEQRRARGWLRAALPPLLARDPTAAFAADVIETLFQTFHEACADDAWRRSVGVQLGAALQAERASVCPPANATRGDLLTWSRATSVLPFHIIETIAEAGHAHAESTAATHLGEAMWQIDDLVDLCQDARAGALNSILLAAGGDDVVATLGRLLASTDIASAARRAADNLQAGLRRANDPTGFLYFVQRYAGLGPWSAS